MKKTAIATAITAILAASPAFAQEESGNKTGIYVSPEVGIAKIDVWCDNDFDDCDDTGFGIGLTGGYRFSEFIAVEGGFRYATGFERKNDEGFSGSSGGFVNENIKDELDYTSWSLGLRGDFPVSSAFSFTGKVGAHFWEWEANTKTTVVTTDLNGNRDTDTDTDTGDDDGTDLYFGVGGAFQISDDLAVRAEWTRFLAASNDADFDPDHFTASLVWSF